MNLDHSTKRPGSPSKLSAIKQNDSSNVVRFAGSKIFPTASTYSCSIVDVAANGVGVDEPAERDGSSALAPGCLPSAGEGDDCTFEAVDISDEGDADEAVSRGEDGGDKDKTEEGEAVGDADDADGDACDEVDEVVADSEGEGGARREEEDDDDKKEEEAVAEGCFLGRVRTMEERSRGSKGAARV